MSKDNLSFNRENINKGSELSSGNSTDFPKNKEHNSIPSDRFYTEKEEVTLRFYQTPKALFKNPRYKGLSLGSKLMYSILRDRLDMSIENNWKDDNSYWMEQIQYKVYFYDDSEICKVYDNGSFEREETFTYGDSHKDDWTTYNTVISDPTVVITINAGLARFRLKSLDPLPDIIRSSSHEWEDR